MYLIWFTGSFSCRAAYAHSVCWFFVTTVKLPPNLLLLLWLYTACLLVLPCCHFTFGSPHHPPPTCSLPLRFCTHAMYQPPLRLDGAQQPHLHTPPRAPYPPLFMTCRTHLPRAFARCAHATARAFLPLPSPALPYRLPSITACLDAVSVAHCGSLVTCPFCLLLRSIAAGFLPPYAFVWRTAVRIAFIVAALLPSARLYYRAVLIRIIPRRSICCGSAHGSRHASPLPFARLVLYLPAAPLYRYA